MDSVTLQEINGVSFLGLNRPQALNALSSDLIHSLLHSVRSISTPALVIYGEGKAFCAGADMLEIAALSGVEKYILLGNELMDAIEHFPGVTLALLHGYALGGGLELALSCDFIMAHPETKLGLPEAKWGLLPGFGALHRLENRLNKTQAKKLIFSAEILTCSEALQIGLIEEIVEGDLKKSAQNYLQPFMELPIHALVEAKKIMKMQSMGKSNQDQIKAFMRCLNHEGTQELVNQFKKGSK